MRTVEREMEARGFGLPLKVAAVMRGFGRSWFVAGGWAIDLFAGRVTRPHADIEVAVFRADQTALQEHLGAWRLQKVVNGKKSPWRLGERLTLPVHEIHCRNDAAVPPRFEVLLNESEGDEWVYRRNETVRKSLKSCYLVSKAGVRFLSPEIVLLYKSKRPRAKDEQDFEAVFKRLGARRKRWLRDAIAACDPAHRWLRRL